MKPDFLLIGFSKCGTTTLYEIFKQHRKIYLSDVKEPWYYINPKMNNKGFRWYEKHYYDMSNNKLNKDKNFIIGEINPALGSKYRARILSQDFDKNTYLLFIMRNPVDRLYSHFKMNLVKGFIFRKEEENIVEDVSKSFDKFVREMICNKNHTSKLNLAGGDYYNQIRDYIKFFDINKIKLILFEDFINETKNVCEDIFEFLNIGKDENIDFTVRVNEGKFIPKNVLGMKIYSSIEKNIEFWDSKFIRNIKFFNDISNYITADCAAIKIIRKFTLKPYIDNGISKRTRKLLEDYYREDKEKLSKLMNRDLSKVWFE